MRQRGVQRARWAFWLLRLYPRRWRDRYMAEMTALLEEHQITLRTLIDLLGGVLDARLTRRDQLERSGPMRSTRSLLQAQLAVFWLFPVFIGAVLYRTSQMIDWDQPGPISNYFSLIQQYPAINLLAATVGVATFVALLAQIVSGVLLLRVGNWTERAFVTVALLASLAGPVFYFGSTVQNMIVIVTCLELMAVALLVLSLRLGASNSAGAERGGGWGSVGASTVTVGAMSVGLIAIALWAGIIWAQGQDLEPNAIVATVAAAIALVALGWGFVSFRAAPRTPVSAS